MCGHVWPCVAMCGHVWPCVAMFAHAALPSVMKPGVKPPLPAASDCRNVFAMKVPMLAPPSAIAAQPASGHTTCLEPRARLAPRNL